MSRSSAAAARRRFAPVLLVLAALVATASSPALEAQDLDGGPRFSPEDVFQLEQAVDPRISPDGRRIVYTRVQNDIMSDRTKSALWIIGVDGSGHRPLTDGTHSVGQARWSPSGDRIAYVSNAGGSNQIWVRWMDSGESARITNLTESPGSLSWSPDGEWIAFSKFVPGAGSSVSIPMPRRPSGAEWAPPTHVIESVRYRADGAGFLPEGTSHQFVVSASGGSPRQVTRGDQGFGGTAEWTPDGRHLILSANLIADPFEAGRNSDIYRVAVADGAVEKLTDRDGPDSNPVVSPDGSMIAYTGYDDRERGYQASRLYLMEADGSNPRPLAADLDRDIGQVHWAADGRSLFVGYTWEGIPRVARVTLGGEVREFVADMGGLAQGRPYAGAQFTVTPRGVVAYTRGAPDRLADVAVAGPGMESRRLTDLNADVLGRRDLGEVEEIWWESSADGRRVQGWIVTPPGFDPSRRYPLMLEIHGGPWSDYGPHFAAEIQLYAARGYVVFYTNPRGSTSYGEEFADLIHHNYPGEDFDDLMSGVDAVIERGYIDEDRLFVTGGSGGGVLTAWIVGHTDRFRAAGVQKPVINWYSWALTADGSANYVRYWLPGPPWEHLDHYMEHSPISYVGNVTTPTMLITGEEDWRTPMWETEQFYQALQIEGVPTRLVRVPGSGHGIASRPSNLIAKALHVLEWFELYGGPGEEVTVGQGTADGM